MNQLSCSKLGYDPGNLDFNPSVHAAEAGYRRPLEERRVAAAGKRHADVDGISAASFPAPLVLPNDDLSLDPGCPPQSVQSVATLKGSQ